MAKLKFPNGIIELANGKDIPAACVKALEEFDKAWPGATLPQARGGIVAAVLTAFEKEVRKNASR